MKSGKNSPPIPPHLALHHQLFHPDTLSWTARFIGDIRGGEERRLPRTKLPTISAPGVWDDNLNSHCLWLAVHGDAEVAPGVVITHTGFVDKYSVLGWISARRLWDSIFNGKLVDQFTKGRQKTNLTLHFLAFTCIPDLYEQELKLSGTVIDPKWAYWPSSSTFDSRTEAAVHLAKCGFSLIEMTRYAIWGQQYICDTLNSSKLDDKGRKTYAKLYRHGLARLQFIHMAEGGDDRTYRLPKEFPLELVLEQRRLRAEKRARKQYQPPTGRIEDVEMEGVTDSIQGMRMTD